MKSVKLFLLALMTLSMLNTSCTNQNKKDDKSATASTNDKVEVYYFHATRRCATCQAVESVTKEALQEYYGDKVVLQSLNFEEKQNQALIEKFQISGQSLLIVKGDKKANITGNAFMNALTKPDKLKEKIKSVIDELMN